jgi:nitrite reductase/ring-hydroxylating ferredoxin subunit
MSRSGKRIEVCRTEDVAAGTALRVTVENLELAVYNLDDGFYVTDDHCTHGPGSLSDGLIEGGQVECPVHGGIFDIRTGRPAELPCTIPVRTYPTSVESGRVFIVV